MCKFTEMSKISVNLRFVNSEQDPRATFVKLGCSQKISLYPKYFHK